MSYYWFRGDYTISLDDPGYGVLELSHDGTGWHVRLTGKRLGRFLAALTSRALGTEDNVKEQWLLPQWLSVAEARELLPALQLGVIAAAAGSGKFERLFLDAEGPPQGPICVDCGAGSFTYPETETFAVRASRPGINRSAATRPGRRPAKGTRSNGHPGFVSTRSRNSRPNAFSTLAA